LSLSTGKNLLRKTNKMNQKEQNSKLLALKAEFQLIMDELESVIIEGAEIVNEQTLNENTLDWVQSYLNGDCSLKTMRAGIKKAHLETLLSK